MASSVRPVILSGGAGTRLWPLSTQSNPKQFLDLLGGSLFEATLTRLDGLPGLAPAFIVTGAKHVDAVDRGVSVVGAPIGSVIVEPAGRNTAPAIIAAALLADPDDVLVVLPADHLIRDGTGFLAAVEAAVSLAQEGHLVLFGIAPSRPEIGYGYIEIGEPAGAGLRVLGFVEKPSPELAEGLVAGGRHLWNSGMFVFKARSIIEECAAIRPDLLTGVTEALPQELGPRVDLASGFGEVDSVSIDHAVMEHTDRAVVVPIDVGWSDVGSWEAVWETAKHDNSDNVLVGAVSAIDVTGSYVHATSRVVAIAGVEDLVVVETPDAVLVVPRRSSQLVRELVAEVSKRTSED
ncbi:MAG TPA: sugar phosphate nucleotidyltransferase [Acidimicrobiia bacterium]